MAKRRTRRGNPRYNWPAIIAAAVLVSAFLIIYLATGNKISDLFPEWDDFTSAVTDTVGSSREAGSAPELSGETALVHFIDVGQGDSMLIQCGGKNILIDAGENDKGTVVNAYLDKIGVETIDLAIGTHPHSDHIGGLDVVLDAHKTGKIILPSVPEDKTPTTRTYRDLLKSIQAQNLKITLAKPGKTYEFGAGTLEILGPVKDDYDSLNDFSVVCRFTFGDWSFLFTGDMESDAEKDLLDAGTDVSARVLKLGHHGSSTSTSQEFLDAVGPEICVMEVGEDNSYNHPHRETVQKMQEGGYQVYRTDLNGSIVFTTDGTECSVETEK